MPKTQSGIEVKKLYDSDELPNFAEWEPQLLGRPGQFPFTRGKTADMYREKPWLMGSYSGFGSAQEANQRYKELLAAGTQSLNVALDLPTQQGMDSDDPRALGEVGRVGVAIDTLADLETLFEGIDLERIANLSCIANAVSPVLLAMFVVLLEKRGIARQNINLYLQNDSLKELTARGNYIFPAEPSLRLSVDVMEYCLEHLPASTTISFCGYHFREAGCDAAQEIALTLANARVYMQKALARGLSADRLGPTLSMFLASGMDLFEEVAKFRVTRRLWARMMRDEFGAQNPQAQAITLRCYTSGSHLTAQQPLNNVVRVTLEALAAVLGGVQAMVTSSMDEALSLPSREAQRTALATQQIIYYESGVAGTPDPLGGSYFLEALGEQLERRILAELAGIDEQGGAVRAIDKGFIQSMLSSAAYERQKEIDSGERVIVGVNKYRVPQEKDIPDLFELDPQAESRQVERLREIKAKRDPGALEAALQGVREAAAREQNVVPAVIAAVRTYASVGEIVGQLSKVYGHAVDPGVF